MPEHPDPAGRVAVTAYCTAADAAALDRLAALRDESRSQCARSLLRAALAAQPELAKPAR